MLFRSARARSVADLLAWLPIEEVIRSRQQGEAIHEALRSEKSSGIDGANTPTVDQLILRDLSGEPGRR
mgnify:FL=1